MSIFRTMKCFKRTRHDPNKPPRFTSSDIWTWMRAVNIAPPTRDDLVAQLRAEIAEGKYETDEKIDQAIDGILADFRFMGALMEEEVATAPPTTPIVERSSALHPKIKRKSSRPSQLV
ncbi:MAG: hypothetical protein ACYTGQ_03305 [Planctomycetota bacterium]|jgi:hypothetical protein